MADDKKKKLTPIDLVGIGKLLAYLVAENVISCDERDRIIQQIRRDNDLTDPAFSYLTEERKSEENTLKRVVHENPFKTLRVKPNEEYISLTEIARAHSEDAPGYII